MFILRYISLPLVLFMLSCGNVPNVTKGEGRKVLNDSDNIITFNMTTSPNNDPIGTRSMGKAKSGEQLEDRFAVKNTTDKPIVILEAKTNCGCVTLDYSKEPIKAGEQRVIKYAYDSRGKIGQQFSLITIKTTIGDYKVVIDLLVE